MLQPKRLLPLAILGVGLAGFAALVATRPVQEPVPTKERLWPVEVVEVRPAVLAPELTLYGKVESPELMKAAAPAASRVDRVLVREGERVEAGQELLLLDVRDYQPRVDQAQAEVADLRAQIANQNLRHAADRESLRHEQQLLALSEAGVKRAERLKLDKLGSESALDQAREALQRQALAVTSRQLAVDEHESKLLQLQARLKRAEAELAQARLALERSRVAAPFAAYIAKVNVSAGDQVQANQLLMSLYPLDGLEVRAKIPAPYADELQRALYEQTALVAETRIDGKPVRLRVDRLSGEADTRGIDALFQIEEGVELLRLGSMLTLHLQRAPHPAAVAVPYQAMYGGNRLYKLIDNRLHGIDVRALGEFTAEDGSALLLVFSPELHDGDRVVTTHLPNAVTGLRVTPMKRSADAGSASAATATAQQIEPQ